MMSVNIIEKVCAAMGFKIVHVKVREESRVKELLTVLPSLLLPL